MGRGWKVAFGAATFWPLIGATALLGILLAGSVLFERGGDVVEVRGPLASAFAAFYVITTWSVVLLVPVLLGVHLVWLFRTRGLTGAGKALWAVALLVGSVFAMPAFFILHVWPDRGREP
jgi:hypothetical protein